MLIYGINAVLEAIRAGRVREVRVSDRAGTRAADAVSAAQRAGVAVRRVQAHELDRAAKGGVHQGVIADAGGPIKVMLLLAQAVAKFSFSDKKP